MDDATADPGPARERPLPALWRLAGHLFRKTPHFPAKWRLCSALVGRHVRGKGYVTTVAFDRGQRMIVSLDDWIPYQVFLTGLYDVETPQTRFFRRLVREGIVVFDVGANVGYYTLQAAVRVAPAGEVHAFEPVTTTYERLVANTRLSALGNVRPNRCLVHEHEGRMDIFVGDASNTGTSSVYPVVPNYSGRVETVDAVTIDGYVERAGLSRVHLVKIDVEGSELSVLRGMKRLLERSDLQLLVEVAERTLGSHGATPGELLAYLRGFHFRPFRITSRGLVELRDPRILKESLVFFRKG